MTRLRLTKISEWLLVCLLVLIGAYTRFLHFPNNLLWTNDVSRDFLVSWQIAHQHVLPTVGHFNTGTNSFYAPYYYYFLGFLAILGQSQIFIYFCFILWQILALVTLYLLAKVLFDRLTGFLVLISTSDTLLFLGWSHYPVAASWSWPLFLMSMVFVAFWQKYPKNSYLWIASGLSFLALQIHGSQLVWLVVVELLMVITFFKQWQEKKLNKKIFFWWILSLIVIALSQLKVIETFLKPETTRDSYQLAYLIETISLGINLLVREPNKFFILITILSVVTVGSIWQKKTFFKIQWHGWWLFLGYVLGFEIILSGLGTRTLEHHQYYVVPVVLILLIGWINQIKIPFSIYVSFIFKVLCIVFLMSLFRWVSFSSLIESGDIDRFDNLYHSLLRQNFPLKTAIVLVTDNDKTRVGVMSNSTEMWWYLVTDLGRQDFRAEDYSFQLQSNELILICDVEESKAAGLTCSEQQKAILGTLGKKFLPRKKLFFQNRYEVQVYESLQCNVF